MTTSKHYKALIIGAGQAGVPLSKALANAGWETALIERQHVGGTCINKGCTPTKTMVASARVAYLARRAADYGVETGPVSVNMVKVRQRKRDMVDYFRTSNEKAIQTTPNLELIMGEASFTDPHSVLVNLAGGATQQITADTIFINTGDRPRIPALKGLENVPYLDSTSIMELDEVPEHLLVLGGGYVGLEFAQMFRRFGSQVTIVQRGNQLLNQEDNDVANEIAQILQQDGIDILLNTEAQCVERDDQEHICLTVRTPQSEQILNGSHILVATGRIPNTDRLNLPAAGIKMEKNGYIIANERLETNQAGVYALGDVKGGPAFTHISYDDFRIIRANLLEGGHRTTQDRFLPYTVFMDPQLGRVGLSESEARRRGHDIRIARLPMSYVARAAEVDETRGFIKAVVDAGSGLVLGCAVLGIEGGEIMAVIQMAMLGKIPYTVLRNVVFAHPTLAESMNNLFVQLQ